MTDKESVSGNNITMNGSSFAATNRRCLFLDPLNNYEVGGLLYIETLVTTAINFVGALLASSGNGIIIVTFWKSNQLRSQSQLFLWCLAFADFVTGLIVQSFYGTYKIAYIVGHLSACCVFRLIFETVAWFSTALSCSLVSSIIAERYLALHYHLRYHDVVTARKITIYLAFLFISTAIVSLSRFAMTNITPFFYVNISGLLLSLLTLLICYWKIYKQVRRHFRQIQDQSLASASGQILDMQRFKKSVINMTYVAFLYLISYIPFTCVLFAYLCNGFSSNVEVAYDITRTLAFMPSSWNPFLYFWKMHELREAAKKVMRRDTTQNIELN